VIQPATHPATETLAEFIDGKLAGETRDAVVEHIEECDDCLMIVGETSRLLNEAPVAIRRSGPRRYAPWMLIAATIAGITFMTGGLYRNRDPLSGLVRASRTLSNRPVEGRLSDFDWLPRVHNRGEEMSADERLMSVQGVAGEVIEANKSAVDNAKKQHAAGVAALIAGYTPQAILLLHRATELAPTEASYWNDLATAYLEAHEKKADAAQLAEALAATDRALGIDAANLPALFNRGVIRDRLGLREQAIAAYKNYLLHDSASPWAEDVRGKLSLLEQRGENDSWEADSQRLEQAAIAGDIETVRRLVDAHPYEARASGEVSYLGAWASSKGNPARERQLQVAAAIGNALQQRAGESMLGDAVAVIRGATTDGIRNALIAGHHAYSVGRGLYRDRDIARAKPEFEKAAAALHEGGSPFAAIAEYYLANCLYDTNHGHDALLGINSLLATVPPKYMALRAQLFWERASLLAREGSAGEALKDQRASIELFDSLGEQKPANIMRSDAAASYALLGRRSDAWRMRAGILRTTREPSARTSYLELAARTEALAGRWDIAESLLRLVLERPDDLSPRVASSCLVWRALAEMRLAYGDEARRTLTEAAMATSRVRDPAMRAAADAEVTFATGIITTDSDPERSVALLSRYITDATARNDPIYVAEALVQRARAFRRLRQPADAERDLRDALQWVARRQPSDGSDFRDAYFATGDSARRELIDVRVATGNVAAAMFGDAAAKRPWLELPAGKVIVQFVTLQNETIILSATSQGLQAERSAISEQDLTRNVDDLVEAIEADDTQQQRGVVDRLAGALISPVTSLLKRADTVVMIPDGALFRLPFSLLVTDPVAVAEAPDVTTAMARQRQPSKSPLTFLAVGNPAIDRATYNLTPLPAAEAEAREIAMMYSSAALCGREATKKRIATLLTQSDLAHLASHAVASFADPGASAILLAPDGAESGALSAREISALPLQRLRVVVLAGCRTAESAQNGGANDSIALAFLRAGAGNVIASLWKIDDDIARTFSLYLHRELRTGVSAAAALRRAQQMMRDSANPRLRAVHSWSGFVVNGSGDR
jgi:CHAT domain-containing protein